MLVNKGTKMHYLLFFSPICSSQRPSLVFFPAILQARVCPPSVVSKGKTNFPECLRDKKTVLTPQRQNIYIPSHSKDHVSVPLMPYFFYFIFHNVCIGSSSPFPVLFFCTQTCSRTMQIVDFCLSKYRFVLFVHVHTLALLLVRFLLIFPSSPPGSPNGLFLLSLLHRLAGEAAVWRWEGQERVRQGSIHLGTLVPNWQCWPRVLRFGRGRVGGIYWSDWSLFPWMDSIHVSWKAFSGLECSFFFGLHLTGRAKSHSGPESVGILVLRKHCVAEKYLGTGLQWQLFCRKDCVDRRQNHFQSALLIQSTSQKVSKPVRAVGPFGSPRVKLRATPRQYMRDKDGVFSFNFLPIIF